MRNFSIVALFFSFIFSVSGQTFVVKDQQNQQTVPFAKIFPEGQSPLLADINGNFSFNSLPSKATIKLNGYYDTTIVIQTISNYTIYLRPVVKELEEIKILPGKNPALRIIDLTVKNRKKNHPFENDNFVSKQYSKFVFDIDETTLKMLQDSSIYRGDDTTLIKAKQFLDRQHLFLIENASCHYFEPPFRQKEIIEAYKISGFSDPAFSTFAREMQSFHFYDNQVEVLGKQYVNPISFGSSNRYLFLLEDSLIQNGDTTFTIFYRPKKGKNFEGLTGRLYINSNGYAIEKVKAEPYLRDSTGIHIQVVQEYKRHAEKWFPQQLHTTIFMQNATLKMGNANAYVVGKGITRIENVQFNVPEVKKQRFNNVEVQTSHGSENVSEKEWEKLRPDSLTVREKNTYTVLDSVVKTSNLGKYVYALKVLTTGKVPLGYINLNLKQLLNFNGYEGYRLGLGLETSEKFIKRWINGGYIAYGFRDKDIKYGGFSEFILGKTGVTRVRGYYEKDVSEMGAVSIWQRTNAFSSDDLRYFFANNFGIGERYGLKFNSVLRANMPISIQAQRQNLNFKNGYSHVPNLDSLTNFEIFSTKFIWTWNIREKANILGNQLIPMGTRFPKIQVELEKGWKIQNLGNLDFWRVHLSLRQQININGFGRLNWQIQGGISSENSPLFCGFFVPATFDKWSIYVPESFQTIAASQFYHQQYGASFISWHFNPIKMKKQWSRPQIGMHYAFGIGKWNNKESQGFAFQSMDKGYHEVGFSLNGLVVMNNAAIGIGVFNRIGYYAESDWKNNIVPKLTIGFKL